MMTYYPKQHKHKKQDYITDPTFQLICYRGQVLKLRRVAARKMMQCGVFHCFMLWKGKPWLFRYSVVSGFPTAAAVAHKVFLDKLVDELQVRISGFVALEYAVHACDKSDKLAQALNSDNPTAVFSKTGRRDQVKKASMHISSAAYADSPRYFLAAMCTTSFAITKREQKRPFFIFCTMR